MIGNGFVDKTALLLKKSLDLRMQNQQVIAGNVANAQTPGYKAQRLEFEGALRQAVEGRGQDVTVTHPQHISTHGGSIGRVEATVSEVGGGGGLGDGNTVSVDQEMILLAQNQIMYEASAQLLSKKMSIIKYVVQGN
ncbi:MAG: flagellar basal-body rod protein FlgB [Desulfuromonadales bacterium C00003068]|jgi:flagellar basal-body rod protein FlgB|nr:flagellar basal body rod protein FlgB [Deltaproteobacteria bacterium]OEU69739.1 MAG: flagellar basal-body rod protein FlgB [Desulfuromonadales bacterium C00003068]